MLLLPFPGQEGNDIGGAIEEPGTVAPDCIGGIGFGNGFWVTTGDVRSREAAMVCGMVMHRVFHRS